MFGNNGHFAACELNGGAKSCWCEIRRYGAVIAIAAVVFAVEVVGGIFSGSLALLSDAGHVLVDKAALVISTIVAYAAGKRPEREAKIRARGGYLNALLLAAVAAWIFGKAIERIAAPPEILSGAMFGTAVFGTFGNYLQYRVLKTISRGGKDYHITHESARLHVLSDLWQSLAVVFVAVLIAGTGQTVIDPIFSVGVAGLMGYWAVRLFKRSGDCHHH